MMASLKDIDFVDSQQLSVDDFCASDGAELLNALYVENDSLILVTEIVGERITYTFFDANSFRKIDRTERYNQHNAVRTEKKIDSHYTAVKEIEVKMDTGFESIIEELFFDGKSVYHSVRERYSQIYTPSLIDRYQTYLAQEQIARQNLEKIIQNFSAMSFQSKVNWLQSKFRHEWRNRCELDFEDPEFFLTEDEFQSLDKDPEFRKVLRIVLDREQAAVGYDTENMYRNILVSYKKLSSP